MLKRLAFLIVIIIAPCISSACGYIHTSRINMAHAIRNSEPVMNPIAKHPVAPRRVASARRIKRY